MCWWANVLVGQNDKSHIFSFNYFKIKQIRINPAKHVDLSPRI